ncbi:hypothetical protein HanIR_Chr12g0611671 [Helianthus annuus]|nr:hypothetical protein HanIR_Chr12g0611671 [Helianthus annuus]
MELELQFINVIIRLRGWSDVASSHALEHHVASVGLAWRSPRLWPKAWNNFYGFSIFIFIFIFSQ